MKTSVTILAILFFVKWWLPFLIILLVTGYALARMAKGNDNCMEEESEEIPWGDVRP